MSDTTTKNLGDRVKVPVRASEHARKLAERFAKLAQIPENSVWNIGLCMLGAQFWPDLADGTLSLDVVREELLALIEEAERVVATKPTKPRKVST